MDEFWLIALPGEPSPAEALAKIDQETAGQNEWSRHRKWNLPDMKASVVRIFDDAKRDENESMSMKTRSERSIRSSACPKIWPSTTSLQNRK